jgi:hypothetical protein
MWQNQRTKLMLADKVKKRMGFRMPKLKKLKQGES